MGVGKAQSRFRIGTKRTIVMLALSSVLVLMGAAVAARMLRAHEPLLLNWFRAKGEITNDAVEGLNNKIRVVTRRSYGFRTYEAMKIALYHTLGRLPEPESTHKYC